MRSFDDIYTIAAERKGSESELEAQLTKPKTKAALKKISDDRWLSCASQILFSAGFNWSVVENKWPRFEEVFDGFKIGKLALMSDEDIEHHLQDKTIIRNGARLQAMRDNAIFFGELAQEHGTAAAFFADWPGDRFVELMTVLKKRGARLGGTTGPYFLRRMGVDSFILTQPVIAALIREGIVDKAATSKRDQMAAQEAFNSWKAESKRPLTQISQVLAMSTG